MMGVILILFRNIRWVVVPLVVVWVSTVWTRAVMAAADIRLSLIGSMTESLITVIGIATVIHVAVLYGEEAATDPTESAARGAMQRTLARILRAFAWTCATTAVGFASIAVSRVRPAREYAVVMACASLFVGLSSFLLVPAGGLVLRRFFAAVPRSSLGEAKLESGLHWIVRFVGRHASARTRPFLKATGSSKNAWAAPA
jgi:predicted RND superfamily exporter protein